MSSKISSSSAAFIIGGNDDLLIAILLFLPAKHLVRFKSVSKRWRSLISDASFCRLHTLNHLRRRPESQPLIFPGNLSHFYNPKITKFFPFSSPFGSSKVQILQSCNGLLLLNPNSVTDYSVFNPTAKQLRELTPLPCGAYADNLYLMFDPSLSHHYRVVCFAKNGKGTLVHVYESETHEWKLGGERCRRAARFRHGIYFNGGIYFLRSGSSSCRFDLDNNMSRIPNPAPGIKLDCAVESNGYLIYLSSSRNEEEGKILNVWEMKENENVWRNNYRVDINRSLAMCGGMRGCYSISLQGMIRGEEEKDALLWLSVNGRTVIYKFHDDVFEVDYDIDPQLFRKDAHRFIHTLAPV